ncbi:MAG: kinase [Sphingomonadales bacterium]|nr:kinase [Sphingomonadales bacterium]
MQPGRLLVLGICGAQGSGKSTLAGELARDLLAEGIATAQLSLDDLYLPRAARLRLASEVHPLFATRGVPGTHDVDLGLAVLDAIERGEAVPLPRFDKARDEPVPRAEWPRAAEQCRVLVLEGWCLGAWPQAQADLRDPVNELERVEDPQGLWRAYANAALGGAYRALFDRVDRLALLAAPGFEVVAGWRGEQEQVLRGRPDAPAAMDEAAIARFIQHYERLTRHILREMPPRADLLVRLDKRRRPVEIVRRQQA